MKIKLLNTCLVGVVGAMLSVGAAAAGDKDKKDPMEELKKNYTFTGKMENCINTRRISSTQAIDDKNILFKMRGKNKYYLNTMKYDCPRLKFENRFRYTLRGGTNLCDIDLIYVMDNFMNTYGGCGLGKFQLLEKLPKDQSNDQKKD